MKPVFIGLLLSAALPTVIAASTPQRSKGQWHDFNTVDRYSVMASVPNAPLRTPAFAQSATANGTVLFEMHPTTEEFNEQLKIVDANNDGCTIVNYVTTDMQGNPIDWPIYYHRDWSVGGADDWVFFPAIEINEVNNLFNFQIDVAAGNTVTAEAFEVMMGNEQSPEAMTTVVMDYPAIYGHEFSTLQSNFFLEKTGTYYIGLHVKSSAQGFRIRFRDLKLTTTSVPATVPAEATDVTAISSTTADGSMVVKVNFKMPEKSVKGTPLDSKKQISVKVVSDTESKTVDGLPGSQQSVTLACASARGTVTLQSFDSNGEGKSTSAQIYREFETPASPVVTAKIADDNMSMHMSWEPVTTGVDGGGINLDKLTYNIYQFVVSTDEEGNTTSYYAPLKTGLTATEYTLTAPAGANQDSFVVMVTAATPEGESDGGDSNVIMESLGQLYSLPMLEDLQAMKILYSGYNSDTLADEYMDGQIGFSTAGNFDENAGSGGAFLMVSYIEEPIKALANLPRFSMKDIHDAWVSLSFWVSPYTAPTEVYIVGSTGEQVKLGSIGSDAESSWKTFHFEIPESFNNIGWANIRMINTMPAPAYFTMLNRFNIRMLDACDVAVNSVKNVSATLGETATIEAVVENAGFETIKAPKVTAVVKNGGLTVAEVELKSESAEIDSKETAVFKGDLKLDKADMIGLGLTITVTAEYDGDTNKQNNTASASLSVLASREPIVTDLFGTAAADENGINLTWSNPITEYVTEGFETYSHGDYSATIGDWSNLDFDGKEVYTIEGAKFPSDVVPKAFQVINAGLVDGSGLDSYSGNCYLIAFSAQESQSDDWFISPELEGGSKLSFAMNIVSYGYDETLEVLYSTTDTELDSFKLLKSYTKTTSGWEEIELQLPDDAKYVALHYASNDMFGVLIDELTYKPAKSAYEFVGFNVYCNGQKINDQPINATDYSHNDKNYYNNSYNVSVVALENGVEKEFALSNTVNLAVAGNDEIASDIASGAVTSTADGIAVDGFEAGLRVAVFNISGVKVAEATTADTAVNIGLQRGIYVVSVGNRNFKVIVK